MTSKSQIKRLNIQKDGEHDCRLAYNAIRTPDGTLLVSHHRHDMQIYTDNNGETYSVDGGLAYLKRACSNNDYEDCSVYMYEGHEIVREYMEWGTFGKEGKDPFRYVKVKDMSHGHLFAVLENVPGIVPQIKETIEKEIQYRAKRGISL